MDRELPSDIACKSPKYFSLFTHYCTIYNITITFDRIILLFLVTD